MKLWQWLRHNKGAVWVEYSALSLIILLPLLLPGYILALDLVFTPTLSWPSELTNTYPLDVLLWLLYKILPGDVVEKLILFVILLCSGVGMHLLVRLIAAARGMDGAWRMAAYFAGVFYMINPFTYSRFMAGQWMVLLGYALLPFFVLWLFKLLAKPSWKTAFGAALWAIAVVTVSLHHAGMVAVLAGAMLVAGIVKYRHNRVKIWRFVGCFGVVVATTLLISSFWLIPAFLGQGMIGQSLTGFNNVHMTAFATAGDGIVGSIGQVIRLQGFWAEARGLYMLPQSLTPLWGIFFIALWALIITGGSKAWRRNRVVVCLAVTSIVVGVVIAATPLIAWLSQYVPLAGGYREPHKFAGLVALGYGLLGAFGVAHVLEWAGRKYHATGQKTATALCLLLPLILTPTMLWGFANQLTPRSYPQGWAVANQKLKGLPPDKQVLFLPWHQYAVFSFSNGRIIATPAEKFFEASVIASDEPEFKNVPPTTPNETKRKIAAALKQPETLHQTAVQLDVSYILLAKEQDWRDYAYLEKAKGFTLTYENANLKLYKVEKAP